MINAISATTSIPYSASVGVSGNAELATLQKELVSYEKQLSAVQSGTLNGGAVQTQLLAAQVSLLTAQIVSLSGVTPVSFNQPLQSAASGVSQVAVTTAVSSVATAASSTQASAPTPTAAPAPTPVPVAATVPDQAALSQAQATLSAIFEKVSVQGTSPPASSTQTSSPTTSTSDDHDPLTAGQASVGSNINVLV